MKKSALLLSLLITLALPAKGQFENYIRISGDAGIVANTERDKSFGMGGTLSWMTSDNIISFKENNFITLSVKGFNNPYGDGKFISSILNGENDGFNYILPMLGYRITQKGIKDGAFAEMRLGPLYGSNYSGFAMSPIVGYAFNYFDISLHCDIVFSTRMSVIGKQNFAEPGISFAYSFGF